MTSCGAKKPAAVPRLFAMMPTAVAVVRCVSGNHAADSLGGMLMTMGPQAALKICEEEVKGGGRTVTRMLR